MFKLVLKKQSGELIFEGLFLTKAQGDSLIAATPGWSQAVATWTDLTAEYAAKATELAALESTLATIDSATTVTQLKAIVKALIQKLRG